VIDEESEKTRRKGGEDMILTRRASTRTELTGRPDHDPHVQNLHRHDERNTQMTTIPGGAKGVGPEIGQLKESVQNDGAWTNTVYRCILLFFVTPLSSFTI